MPFDLALPIASAVALVAAATYVGGPRIRMRTYNQAHGGLRIIEVAFVLSRPRRTAHTGGLKKALDRPAAELAIYMTLKTTARNV